MKRISIVFVITVLLLAFVTMPGCNNFRKIPNKIPSDFDYGSWTGSTYRNDFFGFSITVPENWHIAGEEEMKALVEESLDSELLNKEEMKRLNKMVDVTTANLFYTAQYSVEDAWEKEVFNPSIVLSVENITLPGKQIDRAQYVNIVRQNLSKAIPGLVVKSQTVKTIEGQEFAWLQTQFSIEDITISQENLICLKNGFALSFCLTLFDEEDKKQLDDIMATLKWD